MVEEGKGVALAVLGIVAVLAIVGLVLMFSAAKQTGSYIDSGKYYRGVIPTESGQRIGEVEQPPSRYYIEGEPQQGIRGDYW